jgi:hypothetical protein
MEAGEMHVLRVFEGTSKKLTRMLSVGMLVKKAMKGHVDLMGPTAAVADDELMGPSLILRLFTNYLQKRKRNDYQIEKSILVGMVLQFEI